MGITVNVIIKDYSANDIVLHLNTFLAKILPSLNTLVTLATQFSVYKHLTLMLPTIPAVFLNPVVVVVHCTPQNSETDHDRGHQGCSPGEIQYGPGQSKGTRGGKRSNRWYQCCPGPPDLLPARAVWFSILTFGLCTLVQAA